MTNSLPPNSMTAELTVIGSILYENRVLDRIEEIITPAAFYEALNGEIYETAARLIRQGTTANPVSVFDAMKSHEGLRTMGGEEYLGELLEYSTPAIEAVDMARIVADLSVTRRTMSAARELAASAEHNLADALAEHETALDDIRASMTGRVDVADMSSAGLEGLDDRESRKARKTPTGIKTLDTNIIGLERGAMTVLAARPSMGKTAFGTAIAVNMAKAGRTVGYFSLEMPKSAIGLRAGAGDCFNRVSPQASPRYFDIEQGSAPAHHEQAVRQALAAPHFQRVFMDDRGGLKPMQLSATFRAWEGRARRKGLERPSVVIIDHMGHVQPDQSRRSRTEDMGDVSKALLAFAKRHDVAVLALSQLNRTSVSEGRRPGLHDLRQSGEIEEDAHAVIFLHREEYYARDAVNAAKDQAEYEKAQARFDQSLGKAELIIAKNRNGPVETVTIGCDLPCNAFWDFEGVSQFRRNAG
jgi:replicative DNA helicase